MQNPVEVKLFTGRASNYLASKIANCYGQELGFLDVNQFADGEFQPVIHESVRGAWVFVIQSTFSPSDNLMELLMIIDAAKRASASYITAVIPYFGFARQDRKDQPRVSIGAKVIADLLEAAGANRVMTMELHAGQIQGFFNIPVDHLNSSAIFIPYLEDLNLSNLVFAAPDVGGTKRARAYAKHFESEMVICDKYRERANKVAAMTLIGDVSGKDVVLIDDIIDTGNTLCKAANLIMDKGANSVRAICTHPLLSGDAYNNVEQSALVELVVCDTIPTQPKSEKVKVLSVDEIFATAIRNTHEHKSITSLFIES